MFFFPPGEPQGKDGNQKIRDKCKQYLDRVEELQEYQVNKEVATGIKYIIFVLEIMYIIFLQCHMFTTVGMCCSMLWTFLSLNSIQVPHR